MLHLITTFLFRGYEKFCMQGTWPEIPKSDPLRKTGLIKILCTYVNTSTIPKEIFNSKCLQFQKCIEGFAIDWWKQ